MLTSSICFANTNHKWEFLGAQADGYSIEYDANSVYIFPDGKISFWLKYHAYDREILNEQYKASLLDHMRRQGQDTTALSEDMYCLYKIYVDFTNKQYNLTWHYWHRSDDNRFVCSYKQVDNWIALNEDSAIFKEYLAIRANAIEKR